MRRPVSHGDILALWHRHFGRGAILAPGGYTIRNVLAVIAVVLIGLVALTPFACASTYEAWTEGVNDAELDNDILALLTFQAVIDRIVLSDRRCSEIVVAVVVLADDTGGDLADPSTRSARAPPTA